MAFENGDIASVTLAAAPIRKSMKPYAGCKVLDGTNTENDWIGTVKTKDLPKLANPSKGYFVNANNRLMADNTKNDIGATTTSTARA